jgi:hypothetical protein
MYHSTGHGLGSALLPALRSGGNKGVGYVVISCLLLARNLKKITYT